MRLLACFVLLGFLLAAAAPPAAACDGTPPELINKDKTAHGYTLKCGAKTESGTIPAGGKKTLKEKSGCKLELGDNKPTKLYAEMVCTIKDGKLTCELL